jgi:Phage-related holin (Lysis protein)
MLEFLSQFLFKSDTTHPLYLIIASIYGFITGAIGFAFGNWYGLLAILGCLITLDTILGIIAAAKEGQVVNSKIFAKMFFLHKFIPYSAAIGFSVCIDSLIKIFLTNGIDLIPLFDWLPYADVILGNILTVILMTWLIVKESWSILENLTIIDSKIVPSPIKKVIAKLMQIVNPNE